ncbi:MAG: hypothetical protein ABGY95_11995 [Rubritalea sp.]|uniref:hypothetical protein n=1 Tax=Rubritalea sp. TaxID=2109375 RepID=UPI0032423A8F
MATSELKNSNQWHHQQKARANARMALSIALAELQKYAGPDQRVTAKASLFDTDPTTPIVEGVKNPNLLGVWRNTTDSGLHLVGKDVGQQINPPTYNACDRYIDLRFSRDIYKNNQWRDKLRLRWLGSFKGDNSEAHQLELTDENSITLVGTGTLGADFSITDPAKFNLEKLAVQKIDLNSNSGQGAYAWAVIDNNQKASITKHPSHLTEKIQIAIAQRDNLSGNTTSEYRPKESHSSFVNLEVGLHSSESEILSYTSAAFLSSQTSVTARSLASHFNHFTNDSSGLFTDPIFGGIKKDLTPLLFGNPDHPRISFKPPSTSTAEFPFESSYPIIPGVRHLTHGPNFDALRYWGRLKYTPGLDGGKIGVNTSVVSSSLRRRPTNYWRGMQNDGHTFRSSQWHRDYPKVHPIMTDARFHFYFSLTDNSESNRIRTHLIPRVCLWNPYSIELEVPEMLVLMPNFFWSGGNFHFQLSSSDEGVEGERERLLKKFPNDQSLATWDGKLRFPCGSQDPSNSNSRSGLFPQSRYLAFVIEQTKFPAGSCLVFSPKIQNSPPSNELSIQKYSTDNISENILSAETPQGKSHFSHETQRSPFYQYDALSLGKKTKRTKSITDFFLDEIRLEEVIHYEPWVVAADNFDFILKASNGSNQSSAKMITASPLHPTLQLINGGSGGARTYPFYFYSSSFGNSSTASGNQFGRLQSFKNNPYKDAPSLHQIGAKLLWFNEEYTEGNNPPLRQKHWDSSTHLAYNPATIANWNVRSQLCTRSPVTLCSNDWHSRSSGAWITQLSPHSPQSLYDHPTLNENDQYTKFPFTAANDAPGTDSAILFDLPDPVYGALSIGKLRHAHLSPYSWHPSYLIGSSLPDLHAPLETTAYPIAAGHTRPSIVTNQWDLLIGSSHKKAFTYGPRGYAPKSDGLLQIGDQAEPATVNQKVIETKEEILAYDSVFETNQNIWDSYFISGLQLDTTGYIFVENSLSQSKLLNSRFLFNSDLSETKKSQEALLTATDAMSHAFWNAGYLLKNKSAFNINSTSIPAWCAFLSGIKGLKRPLRGGRTTGGSHLSVFSRVAKPENASLTSSTSPATASGWQAGRSLNDTEIALLATAIVREVKLRGPFISMADMVNRRLIPERESGPARESLSGAIEAAILTAGLNDNFNSGRWLAASDSKNDNNKEEFRHNYPNRSVPSKLWGTPSYLTQGDILEPLAPAMTVRGDTFTIRCYGESLVGSKIKATAYIEAVVVRTPNYMEAASLKSPQPQNNLPTDPTMKVDFASGSVTEGGLTHQNRKYGRRFKLKSFRWLSVQEI